MKILSSLLLFFFLVLSATHAEAINSEFKLSQDITQVKEGDIVEGTIHIWPLENADLAQFKKLEKTVLFNSLYLAQITNLGTSANNADVVELKALFVATSAAIQPSYNFKYNKATIELSSGGIKVAESSDKSNDFYIQEQSLSGSKIWIAVLSFFVILIIIATVKRKAVKKFLLKLRPDEKRKAKKKYDELFRKASQRSDFEALYSEKDKWLSLLEIKAPAHMDFLKILNQYQFKKDWGNDELTEVRSSFDVIRRSFEK